MKKSDIINKDKKELKFTAEEYHFITNKILNDISESLIRGEDVKLRGFGTLKIKMHKAKNGRNPKTGEKIQIPSKRAIKLIPSKKLKTKVENYVFSN